MTKRKARRMQAMSQICERDDCERKGQRIRHNITQVMGVRGDSQRTVPIHVFSCEVYGPQRTLHTQTVGPHGERLEKLGFARYRFEDALTGEVLETERRWRNHHISEQGRERIRKSKLEWWANPQRRQEASEKMSLRSRSIWKDPVKRARMVEAFRRKGSDPEYRKRMSAAQRRALEDPVKRRNRSEGPRRARLAEHAELETLRKGRAMPSWLQQQAGKPEWWLVGGHYLLTHPTSLNSDIAQHLDNVGVARRDGSKWVNAIKKQSVQNQMTALRRSTGIPGRTLRKDLSSTISTNPRH